MPHELHTRFKAIRSGTTSDKSQDTTAAISRAEAGLRYGLRESAAGALAYSGDGLAQAVAEARGSRQAYRRAIRLAFHPRLKEAAQRGGKTGARVMDTAIITFPSSWPPAAKRQAMERVCALYAPPGSQALALAVEHNDKPDNPHFHLYAINGLESHEAADARAAANGTRPRRRLVNRMGDLGSPKKMRAAIAAEMNAVADKMGLERVEHRTLKSRGIDRPAKHLSQPAHRAKKAKEAEQEATPIIMPTPAPSPSPEAPKVRKIRKGGRWITITEKPTFTSTKTPPATGARAAYAAAQTAKEKPKRQRKKDDDGRGG